MSDVREQVVGGLRLQDWWEKVTDYVTEARTEDLVGWFRMSIAGNKPALKVSHITPLVWNDLRARIEQRIRACDHTELLPELYFLLAYTERAWGLEQVVRYVVRRAAEMEMQDFVRELWEAANEHKRTEDVGGADPHLGGVDVEGAGGGGGDPQLQGEGDVEPAEVPAGVGGGAESDAGSEGGGKPAKPRRARGKANRRRR